MLTAGKWSMSLLGPNSPLLTLLDMSRALFAAIGTAY
jgi:hypothetical protein